ncbi:MAG: UDP-N-acetylmuramate--L-alanine ligase [Myxococcales bacterium]|nr:UDP-N-acetylmuramate--L-alanine ligase [Myxococcales bacterium]MCB9643660.1 UDP-N-acetylmuramate--L-alanine ligase [Myxococcales bacterium]
MYQKRIKRIHFVGVGGIGMSGIAEVLHNLGYEVSGSDMKASENTNRLADLGIRICEGHREENLGDADVVVISSAIRGPNPEVDAARRAKIPVIRRAEMLAELMRMKYGIAVAGTHGKTTTTSLIATILEEGGVDPTIVIGGRLNATGRNAVLGQGDFLVAEADESDGSFLRLSPTIAVATNIDPEHMDFFADMDEVRASYLNFLNKVPFYGVNVVCLDHPEIQALLPRLEKRVITYGLNMQADLQANAIEFGAGETTFEVLWHGRSLGRFRLQMLGQHNVLNSLAATAVGLELEIDPEVIKRALSNFAGIQRRFQIWGQAHDVMVVDDYAHHPAELRATLSGARGAFPDRRIVAIFQPHRYSRLRDLFQDFVTSFYQADLLVVTDVYAAGEAPLNGVDARTFAEAARQHGHRAVEYLPTLAEVDTYLKSNLRQGDLLMTMGAGDVWKIARDLAAYFKDHAPQSES